MNIINTIAPISIDELKKYFVDKDCFYVINYKDSKLKGKKLLTYLSNLEIPSDINFTGTTEEEFHEIFSEYLNMEMICNIASLEITVIETLKEYRGITNTNLFTNLIQKNKTILDEWLVKIDSLTLYNMYVVKDEEFKQFVESHPQDDTDSLIGVNFVSLLKHGDFYSLYQKVDVSNLKYFKTYFDEYMFKGKNLYSFWANENNPLFLLTYGISSGIVDNEEYIKNKKQSIQELENASLV